MSRYGKNYTNIRSYGNENTEKNPKQNRDRQEKKRKNTGNMRDPEHNLLGTEKKNGMEHSHVTNDGRSISEEGT
jgi:hypothetical protein